jgi:hypothetical protein
MKLNIFVTYTSLIFFTLISNASAGEQGSLQQCQHFQDKIEQYTNLKRAGGSASQMNTWQKQRNDYKAKFSDYNCKVYRGELK